MPVLPAPTASLPDESSCGTTQPGSPNSCQGNGMGSVGPPQGAPSLARVDPAQPFISTLQVRLSSGPSSSGLHSGGFPEGKQECETVDPRALPLPSPTLTHIPCSSLKSSKSRMLPGEFTSRDHVDSCREDTSVSFPNSHCRRSSAWGGVHQGHSQISLGPPSHWD